MEFSLPSIHIYAGLILLYFSSTQTQTAAGSHISQAGNGQTRIDWLLGKGLDIILEEPFESPSPNIVATEIVVTLEAGETGSPPHTHPGPVVGYVIEGEYLFQTHGEPARILQAGQGFLEYTEVVHIWSGNASNSTVCKVLVVVFGRPGEPIMTPVDNYQRTSYKDTLALAAKNEN